MGYRLFHRGSHRGQACSEIQSRSRREESHTKAARQEGDPKRTKIESKEGRDRRRQKGDTKQNKQENYTDGKREEEKADKEK
jgi:hypothetical protein